MKVKTGVLRAFLQKVMMSGDQKVNEALFDFTKEGLKTTVTSAAKTSRVQGWLKPTGFVKYEDFNKVAIDDMDGFINVLKRFGEDIKVTKQGNSLTISGDKKSVDVPLMAEDFISVDVNEPNLEFEQSFEMPATKLKEIFKDVTMNKDALITLKTDEKAIKFLNTGKYKFLTTIDAEGCKPGVKVDFGAPFIGALENLDGTLEFNIKSDYPVKVLEKTDISAITVIIAPKLEE